MRKVLSGLVWTAVAVAGAGAFGMLALYRGEGVSAAWLLTAAVCSYLVGYRFYSRFIADRVLALDDSRLLRPSASKTAVTTCPRTSGSLFGHHFAAISGPGPLVGPVWPRSSAILPGTLWILIGVRARRRGAGLRDPVLLDAARRQIARPDGEDEIEPRGRLDGDARRARRS